MSWIVVVGNPVDGFSFIGSFKIREDAIQYGEDFDEYWWVAELMKVDDQLG